MSVTSTISASAGTDISLSCSTIAAILSPTINIEAFSRTLTELDAVHQDRTVPFFKSVALMIEILQSNKLDIYKDGKEETTKVFRVFSYNLSKIPIIREVYFSDPTTPRPKNRLNVEWGDKIS